MLLQSYTKRLFLIFIIIFLSKLCSGQPYKYVYYFDEQLASTNASKALVIGKGFSENDLFRLDYFDKIRDNILITAHYTDSSIAILQGEFIQFYNGGIIQEAGDYLNNEKHGLWQKWDKTGLLTDSSFYQHDKVFKTATYYYHINNRVSYFSLKDSLADTYKTITYNDSGVIRSEAFFKGHSGILKTYNPGSVVVDSVFSKEETEASFPGAQKAWIVYLQKNLNANTPVNNGSPDGIFQVIIRFIVTKDGSITHVEPETNFGYGMEEEAIRIIKRGPKWLPAIQFGRNVNAYRRQPITFIVESQK